jgi:cell division protein FtsN
MAQRDYKTRSSTPGKSRGGTIIGIVIGLVLGLLIAVGVAFYLNKGPKPFADKTGHEKSVATKGQEKNAGTDINAPLYQKDAKSADGKKDDDRFSFYKILPGEEAAKAGQDAVKAPDAKGGDTKGTDAKGTDAKAADAKAPDAKAGDAKAGKEQYYLQAGSFTSPGEADNQKARLALMGFEAKVESGEVEGKGMVHRVRIGPYGRLDDINRVRATLAQNGVDASLVKTKEGQ